MDVERRSRVHQLRQDFLVTLQVDDVESMMLLGIDQ